MSQVNKQIEILPLIFIFTAYSYCQSQEVQPTSTVYAVDVATITENSLLNVFIDCKHCDEDFIKNEITFINYVRDRYEAQIHILITTQYTASGGIEYTLEFIGQKDLIGVNDTLKFTTGPLDTEDIKRKKLAKMIKTGLIRYVAKTPVIDDISISYSRKEKIKPAKDPWNNWVFTISLDGNFSGEKSIKSHSLSNSIRVNRITEDWKIKLNSYVNYNKDRFQISNNSITSISRAYSFSGSVVKSMNDHWSSKVGGEVESNTYNNIRLRYSIGPAIEYSIFPYSQSTKKMLCLRYELDFISAKYDEETIYNKTYENLLQEELGVRVDVNEKWGTIGGGIFLSHYFHDFSKYNLNFNLGLSINIAKGFSFNFFGLYSQVHDQLSLPKKGASDEEILLKRSQIATNYRYTTFIGISYTFGSIYSNIVNPRFGS